MAERDPHDVVRLVTAPNPAVAHVWADALRAEGIQGKVVGDYLNAGLGNIPGLTAELWVHREDVARAEEILGRTRESAPESAADEPQA